MEIVSFENNKLLLLDQRAIPHNIGYLEFSSPKEASGAITDMVVRGAPAIGLAAAYAYCLGISSFAGNDIVAHMKQTKEILLRSRPTAVNLQWALNKMEEKFLELKSLPVKEIYSNLLELAHEIKTSEIQANKDMGRYGAEEFRKIFDVKGPLRVITHCNAGALATGGWGTAVGVIHSAHDEGLIERVYADETRPRLQGARLTCFELKESLIPYKLICDNTSGLLMMRDEIDVAVVGADRIAANGDVANKIGTYMLAVLAKRHNVPFYVAAPESTFDLSTAAGSDIEIETRDDDEVLKIRGNSIAPEGTEAVNLAFDISPKELITAYITEKGVIYNPNEL